MVFINNDIRLLKRFLLLGACLILAYSGSVNAFGFNQTQQGEGHYQIKFGGWSDHYISGNASNYNFNERHDGLGVAYSHYYVNSQHFFNGYNYEFWYMKDSFGNDNVQISYGLFHREEVKTLGIENIDFGLNLIAVSRSYAEIDSDTLELIDEKRIHAVFPLPSISVYTSANLHFDFIYLPQISGITDYHVVFFRAGLAL